MTSPAPSPTPSHPPRLIGSDIYRLSSYGKRHPLAIPRVSTTIDLCRALGWLDDDRYIDSPMATVDQLARFHDRAYITAVQEAEETQQVTPERKERYNLGKIDNPVFGEMFRRPATAAGASILAAGLLRDGGVIHSPAGGTHHGRADRASGFCYFNDPVLAILGMLDQGLDRIAYVDVDAHHGDGVEAAFAGDDRVLTISVHEGGRWPFTGNADERAGTQVRNLPVPPAFNDTELRYIVDEAILPLVSDMNPEALVIQCGADGLADDPMSKLSLSNNALWEAVRALKHMAPRLLVLGGGGYNPWSVARAWTGVWAVLNDLDIPDALPDRAEHVLRQLTWARAAGRNPPAHWFDTLADPPNEGDVRSEVRNVVRAALT